MYCFKMPLLTGPFDIYGKTQKTGMYTNVGNKTLKVEAGIFNILMEAGVYIGLICFMVSGVMLMFASKNKGNKLAEAKSFLIKTMLVSVLLFAVCGIINTVGAMGLDN